MIPSRFNKERWEFGMKGQEQVIPLVEAVLGETLTLTERFYDTMDAVSDTHWVEIKTRSDKYSWTDAFIQREGWLVPAAKIERARQETKIVSFFYYWFADNSLWEFEYSPEAVADLTPSIPSWHPDKQPHYYIPQDRWIQIEFVDSL
jgi:hypothetical protein